MIMQCDALFNLLRATKNLSYHLPHYDEWKVKWQNNEFQVTKEKQYSSQVAKCYTLGHLVTNSKSF